MDFEGRGGKGLVFIAPLCTNLHQLCLFFRARGLQLWCCCDTSRVCRCWSACPSIPFPLRYRQGVPPRHPEALQHYKVCLFVCLFLCLLPFGQRIPHLGDASVLDQKDASLNQLLVVMLANDLVPYSPNVPTIGHQSRVERRTVLDEAMLQSKR